ncbi:MAG: 2OG-Fe(II) oxygenase [Pseudomonadota bacterium]
MQRIDHLQDYVFEIRNFLSPEACRNLIAKSEALGYSEALINGPDGQRREEDIRDNDRVITDDPNLSGTFWQKLERDVQPKFQNCDVVGLNERMRFYRYDVGQRFDWHQDGYFERANGERSFFTFMVYLNDDYEGGGTSFADVQFGIAFEDFCVKPPAGTALVFYHPIMHRGDTIIAGRKYVIRSDVMYSPHF